MLEHELQQVRQALATRAPIEQAKGMLMMRYSIPEDRAFQVLVRWSSHLNVRLRTVAKTFVTVCVDDHKVADQDLTPEQLVYQALSGARSLPRDGLAPPRIHPTGGLRDRARRF